MQKTATASNGISNPSLLAALKTININANPATPKSPPKKILAKELKNPFICFSPPFKTLLFGGLKTSGFNG